MDATARVTTMRRATTEDIPLLVRHRRLMFESMGQTDEERNDEMDRAVASYLVKALPSGDYLAWLARTPDGEAVASGGLKVIGLPGSPLNPSGRYSYLMSVYVEPAHRRQGIARQLIEEMIAWSRAEEIGEVRLHASDMGRPLYERMGFRAKDELRLYLAD